MKYYFIFYASEQHISRVYCYFDNTPPSFRIFNFRSLINLDGGWSTMVKVDQSQEKYQYVVLWANCLKSTAHF